jgi:hypothetical protein
MEAVSSYKRRLTGIELVDIYFIYCAVCRLAVNPNQELREASGSLDISSSTQESSSISPQTGKSACITSCARHLELRNATCHFMYRLP